MASRAQLASVATWPVVDRVRLAHPVYSVYLPRGSWWLLGGWAIVTLVWAVAIIAAAAARRGLPQVDGFVALFALGVVVGGVKRGQKTYADALVSSTFFAGLTCAPSRSLYLPATSAPTLLRAALLVPWCLAFGAVAMHSSLGDLPALPLYAALLAAAMALREVTAQAAVAVTLVGVPQYLYLVGGVPMGALLVAATMHRSRLGTWDAVTPPLALGAGLLAVLVGTAVATALAARALTGTQGLDLRFPAARGRRLPLALRLWTVTDKRSSSVLIGFVAFLILSMAWAPRAIDAIPADWPAYRASEIAVFGLYGLCFLTSTLAQEPLAIRSVWGRAPLLRNAGIDPAAEVRHLAWGTLLPTLAVAGAGAVALRSLVAPAIAWPTWLAVAALVAVGAASATVLTTISSATVDRHRQLDDFAPTVLLRTAFVAVLPAALVVGYLADQPAPGDAVNLVLCAGVLGMTALLLAQKSRTIRQRSLA